MTTEYEKELDFREGYEKGKIEGYGKAREEIKSAFKDCFYNGVNYPNASENASKIIQNFIDALRELGLSEEEK